jgi:hypothetical protein
MDVPDHRPAHPALIHFSLAKTWFLARLLQARAAGHFEEHSRSTIVGQHSTTFSDVLFEETVPRDPRRGGEDSCGGF